MAAAQRATTVTVLSGTLSHLPRWADFGLHINAPTRACWGPQDESSPGTPPPPPHPSVLPAAKVVCLPVTSDHLPHPEVCPVTPTPYLGSDFSHFSCHALQDTTSGPCPPASPSAASGQGAPSSGSPLAQPSLVRFCSEKGPSQTASHSSSNPYSSSERERALGEADKAPQGKHEASQL